MTDSAGSKARLSIGDVWLARIGFFRMGTATGIDIRVVVLIRVLPWRINRIGPISNSPIYSVTIS
jgi:hypothetical protein